MKVWEVSIDLDFAPNDREKVYNYIMDRFGHDKTSYILSLGTISDKGTIDEIGRALEIPLNEVKEIKDLYDKDPDEAKQKYPDVFYYFDGMLNTVISQGFHPAGILASPVTLPDNYGVFQDKDDKTVIYYDMEEVHECGLVKYDILGLKNVGIIQEVYGCVKLNNQHVCVERIKSSSLYNNAKQIKRQSLFWHTLRYPELCEISILTSPNL